MRIEIDREANAMYLKLSDKEVTDTRVSDVDPGIIADYDENGEVVGIDILYLSHRADHDAPERIMAELDLPTAS